MSTTDVTPSTTTPPSTRRFTAWPLLASLVGLLGLVALFCEARPDDNGSGFKYPVTAEDAISVDNDLFRIAGVLGYVVALLLLVLAATWHQRVTKRFPDSTGSTLVTFSAVATAALVTLAFGWRGALGNYLPGGPEENTYDTEGLYNYYVMNDFSPYISFIPLLGACYGLAWMALKEGLVSKPLGVVAGVYATLLIGAVAVTGVPGLPAIVLVGLIIAGIWLAVGRSRITQVG
ncbi:hypothetical protein [Nocardioides sp. SYSU D00038]|uniref:hypothetical protein n=1 Tax=Nocardioides sp. SYSU D00038 TaxID=2812554 RepID=UPI001967279C|nr:hypothetical protein [Nocardioides sp. SYSU D00038]